MSRTASTSYSNPIGVCTRKGFPDYQHDRYVIHKTPQSSLYAVLDGHGSPKSGHLVSEHISKRMIHDFTNAGLFSPTQQCQQQLSQLSDALNSTDDITKSLHSIISNFDKTSIQQTAVKRVYAGSTLNLVLRVNDTIWCANVGDSRAIMISVDGTNRQLSNDHVCTDPKEYERIINAGGIVTGDMLNGYISMSRALGDQDLKEHRKLTKFPIGGKSSKYKETLFTGEPDIKREQIRMKDIAIVVASDGIWGKLSNEIVTTIVFKALANGTHPDQIASSIIDRAFRKGSKDNATVIVALVKDAEEITQDMQQADILPNNSRRTRFKQKLTGRGSRQALNSLGTSPPDVSMDSVEDRRNGSLRKDASGTSNSTTGTISDIDTSQDGSGHGSTRMRGIIENGDAESSSGRRRQNRFKWVSRKASTLN